MITTNLPVVAALVATGNAPWTLEDYAFAVIGLGIILVAMIRQQLRGRRQSATESQVKRTAKRFRKHHRR